MAGTKLHRFFEVIDIIVTIVNLILQIYDHQSQILQWSGLLAINSDAYDTMLLNDTELE